MLLPIELASLIAWFAAFQSRIGELVADVMQTASEAEPEQQSMHASDAIEWGRWLDDRAHPELHGMRGAVWRSLARLDREHPVAVLATEVHAAIAELPEQVELRNGAAGGGVVPLRRWFELELITEVDAALIQLESTLVEALRDVASRIVEVERVLDYYSLAVQRHQAEVEDAQAEEFARTGLVRVQNLIAELQRRRVSWARRALGEFVDRTACVLEDASAPYRAHRPEAIRRRLDERERLRETGARPPTMLQRSRARLDRAYRVALPLARQLVGDLRALFGEHEPLPAAKVRSSLAGDPAELGSDLPLGYRRLFASMAIEIADLYVRRPLLEAACTNAIEAWSAGIPQVVLLHGDRGSGKRTLINHVLARVRSQALLDVRWVRLGPSLHSEAAVAKLLGSALGVEHEAVAFAELALEPGDHGRRRVIVVENTERLLVPSPAGVARMTEFLALVGATATTTLWILLMATPAASLVLHRLGFGTRIPTVLHVEPMTGGDLHALIHARHRLSGFELEYADPGLHLLDRLGQPWLGLRSRSPSEIFDERLRRLTGGNPRQALYTWLAQAHPHGQREGRIVVDPLPATPIEVLGALSIAQRLILALLAQHGSLSRGELVKALSASRASVEGDLEVLWARGLLAPSREAARHWTLQPTIAHPLLMELRSINMI